MMKQEAMSMIPRLRLIFPGMPPISGLSLQFRGGMT
jgi:hypothetical protein